MESRNVPYGSVVLSPEDAQALFAVINRTSGTIHWPSVASDIGTTVEIVRERYMRILSANSAIGLARPQAVITTTTSGNPTTASPTNDPPIVSSSSSAAADTTPASNPTAPSTASTATHHLHSPTH